MHFIEHKIEEGEGCRAGAAAAALPAGCPSCAAQLAAAASAHPPSSPPLPTAASVPSRRRMPACNWTTAQRVSWLSRGQVALSTRTAERDSRCLRFFSQPLSALSCITSSKGRNAGTQARQTQPSHAPLFVPCACHSFQAPHLRRHSRGLSSCREGARKRENLDAAMMTVGVFSSRRLSAASRRRSKEDFAGRNTPRQACGSLQLRPVLPGCRSDALLPAPSLGRISSSGSGSCLLAFRSSRGRGCSFAPSPPSLGIRRLRVLLREHLRAPSSTQAAPPPPVTSPRGSP